MQQFQQVCTSGFIMNDRNELLLVKRADNDDFLPGLWELPGGGTDFGENPQEALKREVFEEVGLSVSVGKPLTVEDYFMENDHEKIHRVEVFYLCSLIDTTQEVQLSFEHSAYKWVKQEDLPRVGMTEYMEKAIAACFANR